MAYLYWRIEGTSIGATYLSIAEIEMRATVGGADQCSGGTATASSFYTAGREADKAFDNSTGTLWESASGAGPHWIQYQFASAVDVQEVVLTNYSSWLEEVPGQFTLKASNDGTNWTSIRTFNCFGRKLNDVERFDVSADKAYWRWYITETQTTTYNYTIVHEFELHSSIGGANIATGGQAGAVGSYQSQLPDLAVDGNTATYWESSVVTGGPWWIGYHLPVSTNVVEYVLKQATTLPGEWPRDWLFQYSGDGVNWTTADTQSLISWSNNETKTFSIATIVGQATGVGGADLRGIALTLKPSDSFGSVGRGIVTASGNANTLAPGQLVKYAASGAVTSSGSATADYLHAFQAKKGIKQRVDLRSNNTYAVSVYVRRKAGWTAPYVVAILSGNGKEYEGHIVATPTQINAQTVGAWVRYEIKVTPVNDRDRLTLAISGASGAKADISATQVNRGRYARAYLATNEYTSSGKSISNGGATTIYEPYANAVGTYTGSGAAAASGSASTGTLAMMFALPVADTTIGGWIPLSGSDLYALMDEANNDAEYIVAEAASTEFEVRIGQIDNAGTNDSHSVVVRAKGAGLTLTLKVYDGANLIATRNQSLSAALDTYQFALTPSEVSNITNRADVRIRGAVA